MYTVKITYSYYAHIQGTTMKMAVLTEKMAIKRRRKRPTITCVSPEKLFVVTK